MPSSSSAAGSAHGALALYLGVVQFFFATTWILYVIYLPQLAAQAGIGREWVPWILVADQVVFAVMDVLTGFWIDRVRSGLARFGGWILGLTVLSGLAFLLLPFSSGSAEVLLAAILVWSITSSALRAPPWALLGRYAAAPQVPWLSAVVLAGSGIAAALSPYLGIALKNVDPRLPFLIATATLVATVAGLVYAERRVAGDARPPVAEASAQPDRRGALSFFAATLLMAAGFQVHFALNSPAQYLRFAPPAELPYLMPVFWVGFNVLMFPAAALAKRFGALPTLAASAMTGALAILAAVLAPGLGVLAAAQFLAGGCWGAASIAVYTAALGFGRTGREGRFLGTLFAVLAVAAFFRIAAYASDLVVDPDIRRVLPWLPPAAWISAALLLLARFSRRA